LPLPCPAFRVRCLPALARHQRSKRRAGGVIAGRFELHPAWNLKPSERRVSGSSAGNAVRIWQRRVPLDTKEWVMGLGKKAKNKAKAVKGKTKKDAGKVKHKGKKAKNAVKH
jgi:hypothetical protein